MAAAAAAATASIFVLPKPNLNPNNRISHFAPKHFSNPQSLHHFPSLRCTAVQLTTSVIEEGGDEIQRKLYAVNLPWSISADEIEKLFAECGTVEDVEIIKRNGKSRGFAFITMSNVEEARAAVDKFTSVNIMHNGRNIRVEFAKSFKKPSAPSQPGDSVVEERHKIFVSNLAWKVRASDLRTLFSNKFKPISARVVFDNSTKRSAGYGFVGFATEEEAEAAVSELDGKELMGRPLRLRISERRGEESEAESEDSEEQPEES